MKILIVNNMAPFIWGGAEELAIHLQKNLIIAGHEAEILRIPFQWEPATRIPSQMLLVKALELWNVDQVIALKFPAYLIRHPRKTIWLLHQYRQAYDLYDCGKTNIPSNKTGEELRQLIKKADEESLSESSAVFTNSKVTGQRLVHYNNIESKVLFPPLNDAELFTGGTKENYIFAGGRINDMKRQYLLIEAMRHTDKGSKLLIAGPPDSTADVVKLKELIGRFNLEDKVRLDLRFLPRKTYADYVNNAAAIAYLPFDEDSLGYVAMEAASAGKAIITAKDSGGVLDLVKHEETGWITDPTPLSLAEALNSIRKYPIRTLQYGLAAKELWLSLKINWPQTVETLLQ